MGDISDEDDFNNEDDLIEQYFLSGISYEDIRTQLLFRHDVSIGMSALKKRINKRGLFRKKYFSPLEDVINFIAQELEKSGKQNGYKWVHMKCLQKGFTVTQDMVRQILNELDEEGVALRTRRKFKRRTYSSNGPSYTYHMDGYDKLKPFGLCISGCIDGFSRHIMWLRVGHTNNDPKVIAGYYVDTLQKFGGCPLTMRSDLGTENTLVKQMQIELREAYCESSRPPFLTGKSCANQRIEAWWAMLRKENCEFWISYFRQLIHEGFFSGDLVDKELIRFCYMEIIQNELDEVASLWNHHRIRKSKMATVPGGRPVNMFFAAETYNVMDYLVPIPIDHVQALKTDCRYLDGPCANQEFNELCSLIMEEHSLTKGNDVSQLKELYLRLRNTVRALLDADD